LKLSDEEKRMLDGARGEATQLAMQIITEIGETYGAQELIQISSVHAGAIYPQLESSPSLLEKFANLGAKFKVPTTIDPSHNVKNFDKWPDFKDPEDFKSRCIRLENNIMKMGATPTWSCTPYFQGNIPRFKQDICWMESSAISFANSVLGARTNRTTMGVDIAAAITGRVAKFGLHLERNRVGNVLIKMEFTPKSLYDYHTIGYIVGKYFGDKVPVFENLPEWTTANQLKCLGAAAASRGAISLYHAVGITPEARTMGDVFKKNKPEKILKIGEKEIKEAIEEINTYKGGHLDAVLIGCPHPHIEEIEKLALLLYNKKVRKDIKFCLFISSDVFNYAQKMGLIKTIEESGVSIFEGECIIWNPTYVWNWKNVATNSAKYANILPSDPTYMDVLYVNMERCVELSTE